MREKLMSSRLFLTSVLLVTLTPVSAGVDSKKANALLRKYLEKSLGKSPEKLVPTQECEEEESKAEIKSSQPVVSESPKELGTDPAYAASLKNYPNPSRGCIPRNSLTDAEVNELIDSQNFRTVNGSTEERRTLALAIKRAQELDGGVFQRGMAEVPGGFPFIYKDSNGSVMNANVYTYPSGKVFKPYEIRIGRNLSRGSNQYGLSVAQHVHEWGHMVGRNGAYDEFAAFMNAGDYSAKDYCMVSNYADDSPGEQFAEVFAAFLTEPRILLVNSRTPSNCKKVFDFFKSWFKAGEKVESCL